ncbi:MAG: lysophospholipid acyltransferase family protein [Polyangiales bacterium]
MTTKKKTEKEKAPKSKRNGHSSRPAPASKRTAPPTKVEPVVPPDVEIASAPEHVDEVTGDEREMDFDDGDELGWRATLEPRRDVAEISAYVPEPIAYEEADAPEEQAVRAPVADVEQELRAVEAELDRMWAGRPRRGEDGGPKSVIERIREAIPVELPGEDGSIVDAAKDVLSTDYYLRQWGKIGLRNRSEEVDEFGLDPVYEKRLRPVIELLYKHYFRVETQGIENIPTEGRCILVANHSGVLPYDGMMVRTALRREHPSKREMRWLAEDFIFHLPFLGAFMNRIGAVRACQENAERLLKQERAVLVFPEGIKGIGKLYRDKYRLQRFGRGGFIKLALRTQAPLIPVSIIGAEESAPMLYRIEYLTQALGLPFVPVTPTFPLLGPLGLVPAPTKWKISFGAPIHLTEHGAEAADDALLVGRIADRVRSEIQASLDKGVQSRKSVWFG